MRIHFIAIGGSAMHNLAIALKNSGAEVSGSDDEIFEPSASRLKKHGLLPEKTGWNPNCINENIDAIILGMHARKDNPELLKAQELNLKIYSYPEFLFEKTKNKTRVVIGGSHGKTTVTSMIMHVLKSNNISFDYMVGANISGFETMVNLQDNNKIAVFEGDEYLSSPIDLRPKFHLYKPHIAVLTGIAWDHINVFPEFENYIEQFDIFLKTIEKNGQLFYFADDKHLQDIVKNNPNLNTTAYRELESTKTKDSSISIINNNKSYKLNIFGKHNLQNLNAALLVCKSLGLTEEQFYETISDFQGAAKRLQLLQSNQNCEIYLDFAHAPSKVKATVTALKEKFPQRHLTACLELHTFSSLKKEFLPEYNNSMQNADDAIVYFNPKVVSHKKLESLDTEYIKECFGGDIKVFTCSKKMQDFLNSYNWIGKNLIFMSSGNFNGINFAEYANKLIEK